MAIHPGEFLREDFMKPLSLSVNALALALRVPATRISEIVHERRGITADTAIRLGIYFGTTTNFWMNMQIAYELAVAQRDLMPKIYQEVKRRQVQIKNHSGMKRSA
ncbi:MAG TPA: HigA family addiction module antitoxin [Acidobacteriaceae bacterium]|nr:HigA family addiction module antitoxin [Acidobacteriaceae bacterium]